MGFPNPSEKRAAKSCVGDDLWTFVPTRTGRPYRGSREFCGRGLFQCRHVAHRLAEKFAAKILKDLPNQWIIELDAKDARSRLRQDASLGRQKDPVNRCSSNTMIRAALC